MKLSFGALAIASLALVAAGSATHEATSGGGAAKVPAKAPAAKAPAAKAPAAQGPAATALAARGTLITTHVTSFGTALVVGSGEHRGFSLYFITSDHGRHFGCTARPVETPIGKVLCTGPSSDRQAEWPAITTAGKPRAGVGVSPSHLGTVSRPHVGLQITYYGHPLYLYGSRPGRVNGEGRDEPSMPPWHGVWYLMSPCGKAAAWPGALTTVRLHGHRVLAAPMLTDVGWLDFPVYRYSKDEAFGRTSRCTGYCARRWPPVLTSGFPGVSAASMAAHVGALIAPEGTQVSYAGHPLYLFAGEVIVKAGTTYKAIGSGDGMTVNRGTFKLVTA
jgi:predicted lipoprotein with Yx(FWY)xxD motif